MVGSTRRAFLKATTLGLAGAGAVMRPPQLEGGTWYRQGPEITACFDLPRGPSHLLV